MTVRHGAALLALLFSLSAALPACAAPDALNALKTIGAQTDKYRSLMSNLTSSEFHLVAVPSSEASSVAATAKKEASSITGLRESLAASTMTDAAGVITTMQQFLKPSGITVDRIVAVSVQNGQITLFYI